MSALLLLDPTPLPDGLGIPAEDWHQTPTSVRHHFLSLLKRVETLEARCNQDSSNSSRPPSTDSPPKKRARRTHAADPRKPGAKPGHPGHHQGLLEPTASVSLLPDACACGHCGLAERAGRCWGLWSNSGTIAWLIHLLLEPGEAPVCVSNFSSSCAAMRVQKRPSP